MDAATGIILMVNADQLEAQDLHQVMRHQGVSNPLQLTRDATSALAALTDPAQAAPAMVLVDLDHAATGGLSLIAAMGDDDSMASIPLFVITAQRQGSASRAAAALGVTGFIDSHSLALVALDQLLVQAAAAQADTDTEDAATSPAALILVEPDPVDARAVVWALRRQRIINVIEVAPDGLVAMRQLRQRAASAGDPILLVDLDRPMPGVVALLRSASRSKVQILGLCTDAGALPEHIVATLDGTVRKGRIGDDFRKALDGLHVYWQAVFTKAPHKRGTTRRISGD